MTHHHRRRDVDVTARASNQKNRRECPFLFIRCERADLQGHALEAGVAAGPAPAAAALATRPALAAPPLPVEALPLRVGRELLLLLSRLAKLAFP